MVKTAVIGGACAIMAIFALLLWLAELAERKLPTEGEYRIEAVNVGGMRQ